MSTFNSGVEGREKVVRQEGPKEIEWSSRKWIAIPFREGEIKGEVLAREGFSASQAIRSAKGPTIEVAGPTDNGFFFHDAINQTVGFRAVDLFKEREAFVSNLLPGAPKFTGEGWFRGFHGLVDFMADAQKLPIKEGSVAVLFCSCIGPLGLLAKLQMARKGFKIGTPEASEHDVESENSVKKSMRLREKVIQEARRVLRDGGFLVWQGAFYQDLTFALNNGFTLLQIEERKTSDGNELAPNMILQKKDQP